MWVPRPCAGAGFTSKGIASHSNQAYPDGHLSILRDSILDRRSLPDSFQARWMRDAALLAYRSFGLTLVCVSGGQQIRQTSCGRRRIGTSVATSKK